jgi:hypothetical protein
VYAWVKKYWKEILIIPMVIYFLIKIGGLATPWFKRLLKPPKPDLRDLDNRIRDEDRDRDRETDREIDRVDADADRIKDGIDNGDPTPADVFNEEIKK